MAGAPSVASLERDAACCALAEAQSTESFRKRSCRSKQKFKETADSGCSNFSGADTTNGARDRPATTSVCSLSTSSNDSDTTQDEECWGKQRDEHTYIPNTSLPADGWLKPCRWCGAFTSKEVRGTGKTIALCPRCNARYVRAIARRDAAKEALAVTAAMPAQDTRYTERAHSLLDTLYGATYSTKQFAVSSDS